MTQSSRRQESFQNSPVVGMTHRNSEHTSAFQTFSVFMFSFQTFSVPNIQRVPNISVPNIQNTHQRFHVTSAFQTFVGGNLGFWFGLGDTAGADTRSLSISPSLQRSYKVSNFVRHFVGPSAKITERALPYSMGKLRHSPAFCTRWKLGVKLLPFGIGNFEHIDGFYSRGSEASPFCRGRQTSPEPR